ncbi:MAG TPA: hypothetical protein P5121_17595 [Caldilineaceae bacterium]|mgnify:CR=1 FL=1|nr:hypothetical protein [Caldilineaceae bacterium]
MNVQISLKVHAVAQVMQRFSAGELRQLIALVPALQEMVPVAADPLIAHFRALGQAQRQGQPANADDQFLGGLTYAQYFGLSEAEQDALWAQLFVESTLYIHAMNIARLRPFRPRNAHHLVMTNTSGQKMSHSTISCILWKGPDVSVLSHQAIQCVHGFPTFERIIRTFKE